MTRVVFLRGINVGGHRRFRPAALARQLAHLGAVNVGAAGTFVVRGPVTQARLRAEITRSLPFEAEVMVCEGRALVALLSREFFRGFPERPDIIRFVSVLSRRPRTVPRLPVRLPSAGDWLVKALAVEGRFVVGVYQRQMRAITQLGALDGVFGSPATTRSWSTMVTVGRLVEAEMS